MQHKEYHRIGRIGWLRAAVLGANDGIISTASLLIAVAAAHTPHQGILIAGIAGLIAGAMSMAAGEYISVSSQADTEKSALQREQIELEASLPNEIEELTTIYINRGLEPKLAKEVVKQLMAKDPLGSHARDELGITEISSARPFQAALFSAGSFTLGSLLPLLIVLMVPGPYLILILSVMAVLLLALLGGVAAKVGGAKIMVGTVRVVVWGSLAMLVSAGIGSLLGIAV
ncbi:VIT1/CCC1 transporter family protein [Legionella jordanis]|uniref:Integral membrane protein n=1 Tax=Legionella jordanis TaxID=456 RepID=A0A0W0VC47_9GAMM|nr:VIT family protein [Legionella jordanis]KTD17687.1 integral membrane protein [Legionella jordanis]RMX01559.1 VIT family protein [Legionella jordanis]RMX21554.1 VIT family protein [Legionella jordanis]VEH11382.1 integral membrane protein [Legionella jordanis]HAT8715053.1 VIT family protein [Legionella jordanis]